MPDLLSILGGPVKGLVEGVGSLVDRFVSTPDEKKQFMKDMAVLEHSATVELEKLAVAEYEARVDIIKAEAQSEDKFVRRARPTFLYLMYVILGFNYIIVPIAGSWVKDLTPIDFPSQMWWVFASGYLGYAYFRSKDKGSLASAAELFGFGSK